jgi:hypothetical protein
MVTRTIFSVRRLTKVGGVDAFAAGLLGRTLDPIHSISYFVPEVAEKFGALGMEGRMPYFAARSAPMGAVSAATVTATFYNFSPALVASVIPAAWELASPSRVTEVRYEIVAEAIPRVVGDLATSADVERGAAILRKAADSITDVAGRPLYAAHAELPWPDSPIGQLWHAQTLLREYRGDGHIAALITHELGGLEALVSHSATGIGFNNDFARLLRGWTEEEWEAAVGRLQARGVLDKRAELTPMGNDLRSRIEDLTDDLAYQPWRILSDDEAAELTRLAKTIREVVVASGALPSSGFGARWGEHR